MLLFCGWLLVCCFSLSASEPLSSTPKALSSYISFSTDSQKSKKTVFVKIKLLWQKARLILAEYTLPKIADKKPHISIPDDLKLRGSFFKYFDYKAAFNYLFPKHAFW